MALFFRTRLRMPCGLLVSSYLVGLLSLLRLASCKLMEGGSCCVDFLNRADVDAVGLLFFGRFTGKRLDRDRVASMMYNNNE